MFSFTATPPLPADNWFLTQLHKPLFTYNVLDGIFAVLCFLIFYSVLLFLQVLIFGGESEGDANG